MFLFINHLYVLYIDKHIYILAKITLIVSFIHDIQQNDHKLNSTWTLRSHVAMIPFQALLLSQKNCFS